MSELTRVHCEKCGLVLMYCICKKIPKSKKLSIRKSFAVFVADIKAKLSRR